MKTDCNRISFTFHPLARRAVVAKFDGGTITSDAGALLLREVAQHTGILEQFARCFTDHRDAEQIEHTVEQLVAQRVYGLALGYEDLNDHDQLRRDPLLAALVGKPEPEGTDRLRARDRGMALAGKSTLNRLELGGAEVGAAERYKKITVDLAAVDRFLVETFLQAHESAPPARIILDLDCTDDPIHGAQEGRFFHGYYREYCYLPLYIFAGEELLCARLRTADQDAAAGAAGEVARIVAQLRQRWGQVEIWVRGDSGYCREELMAWCEAQGVGYILGLAKNERLVAQLADEMSLAKTLHEQSGQAARVFKDLEYRTRESWSQARRVVGKAEHLAKGANPRFVVTSLPAAAFAAQELYEDLYCARGEMENRIKEQQLYLFADRTSAATMRANQLRLWFSSVAYLLLQALRRLALAETALARAQCQTIRLKLLKIGAQVKVTVRRVIISLAEGCPYATEFAAAYARLQRLAPLRC